MTIERTFVCERHDEWGTLGWRPEFMPGDPYPAMAVAHDVLEHLPGDDGGAEAEFSALGAAVYVRGETGWFYSTFPGNVNSAEQHISSDFRDIMQRVRSGEQTLRAPRRTCSCDADSMIETVIRLGSKNMVSEGDAPIPESQRKLIRGWMRIGYRSAARRYRVAGQHGSAYLFTTIMEGAARALKMADEGCKLLVSVNLRRGSATTKLQEPDYD